MFIKRFEKKTVEWFSVERDRGERDLEEGERTRQRRERGDGHQCDLSYRYVSLVPYWLLLRLLSMNGHLFQRSFSPSPSPSLSSPAYSRSLAGQVTVMFREVVVGGKKS